MLAPCPLHFKVSMYSPSNDRPLPPFSSTGGDQTKTDIKLAAGLDYLRGTLPIACSPDLHALLEAVFNEKAELCTDDDGDPLGMGYYKLVFRSPNGILLQAMHRLIGDSDPKQHQLLTLSGQPLSRLDMDDQDMLLTGLASLGFKPTRMDVKIDDYSKTCTPALAYEAAEMGNRQGFRKFRRAQDSDGGYTFYGGTRGKDRGGKFLRIYNKTVESRGEIDAIRIEVELSAELAIQTFDKFVVAPVDQWPTLCRRVIGACYKFLDRSVSSRADRCPLLPWWAFIVGDEAPIKFTPVVRKTTLEERKKWLFNQVSKVLSLVLDATEQKESPSRYKDLPSFLRELLLHGESKRKEKDKQQLETYIRQTKEGYQPSMA